MRRIRQASMRGAAERRVTPYTAPVVVTAVGAVSYESSSPQTDVIHGSVSLVPTPTGSYAG
jgi:hypothetical protein